MELRKQGKVKENYREKTVSGPRLCGDRERNCKHSCNNLVRRKLKKKTKDQSQMATDALIGVMCKEKRGREKR